MSKKYILIIIALVTVGSIYLIANSFKDEKIEYKPKTSKVIEKVVKEIEFEGEKGETLELIEGKVGFDAKILNDGIARYYNVKLYNGDIIYFFVVKDKNGVYRAAANACQVCYDSKQGFRQEGDNMICNTCGNAYPLEKIATEKGGCNPGPINPNLEVKDGTITIGESELEQVSDLFN